MMLEEWCQSGECVRVPHLALVGVVLRELCGNSNGVLSPLSTISSREQLPYRSPGTAGAALGASALALLQLRHVARKLRHVAWSGALAAAGQQAGSADRPVQNGE